MAAGDFTIDSKTFRSTGNMFQVSGTVEVSATAATAAIFPNGYIVSFSVDNNLDDVDVDVPRVAVNASDFASTAANGSVHIDGSAGAPDTLSWTATYV